MRNAALSLFAFALSATSLAAGHDLAPPVIGSAAYPIQNAKTATNGKTFLSVWRMDTFGGGAHIYGSLADSRGNLLTPESFQIVPFAGATGIQLIPYGDDYVITWFGGSSGQPNAAELSSDGKVLRTFSLPYAPIVSNGEQFLTLSASTLLCPCKNILSAATFDRSGRFLKSVDLYHSFSFGPSEAVAVGGDFIVAAATDDGLAFARVSANGELESQATVVNAGYIGAVALASNETDVAVIWSTATDVFASVIHSDGTTTPKSRIATGVPGIALNELATGHTTDGYLVAARVQTDSQRVDELLLRLDNNGALLGSKTIGGAPNPLLGAIAIGPNRIYDVRIEGFPTGTRVAGRSFSFDVQDVHSDVLSTLTHRQFSPVIASDGVDFFTAWSDDTAETQAVTCAALSNRGEPLNATDVQRVDGWMGEYAIAYGGSAYLVVWHFYQQLYAQRFAASGAPLDPTPMMLTGGLQSLVGVSAAWNGSRFFVAWTIGEHMLGAFVNGDGMISAVQEIFAPPTPVPFGEHFSQPDVAWDGTRFLVVWQDTQNLSLFPCGSCFQQQTEALRVSADGFALDADATVLAAKTTAAHVASSGHDFAIAVDSYQNVSTSIAHANGASLLVEPALPLFHWWNDLASDIAWNGSDYVIAFRYGIDPQHVWLAMRRLNSAAAVVTETGPPDFMSPPALASNMAGDTLAVISEIRAPESARARSYFESEMLPMPAAPAAPTNVRATRGHNDIVVTWAAASGNASGFLVVGIYRDGTRYPFATAADKATSATINDYGFVSVEVSAFNAGGISDTVRAQVGSSPRRRATR